MSAPAGRSQSATILLLSSCLAVSGACRPASGDRSSDAITFWAECAAPYSSDPIDFDAGIHHGVFTSVYSWIVTDYTAGGIRGQLAQSWDHSPDFKRWTFVLRPDLTFENGDPITPKDVVASWTRLLKVLKQNGSKPEAMSRLEGYPEFPEQTAEIAGMSCDARSVTLRFTGPVPDLLDTLAFGLYAVVHPSAYDHRTGRWLDHKKAVSSGAYKIAFWDGQRVLLSLRPEFPADLRHPKAIAQVEIRWDPTAHYTSDLTFGDSISDLASRGYVFYGAANSSIAYLRCQSWLDPASPLADRGFRRRLREAFYSEVRKRGVAPVRSFFPLTLRGIREFPESPLPDAAPASHAGPPLRFSRFSESMPSADDAQEALKRAASRLGLSFAIAHTSFKVIVEERWNKPRHYQEDVIGSGTDIDINGPDSDIRFMFDSRQGIGLPDPSGRAHAALARAPADLQEVNRVLWDDAIIWPFLHYADGRWAKPDLDLSLINRQAGSTPLHLIGRKAGIGPG